MPTPVTILHEAEIELWESVAYYEEKAIGLGSSFETEVEAAVQQIQHSPELWPLRKDGTRRMLLERFPFLVVYLYSNDHIWIISFAHCKRKPGYWKSRI